ncbi:MAG: sugar transferase [Bacteroidales bacterium]
MKAHIQIFKYVLADLVASMIGWFLFNIYRYEVIAKPLFSSRSSYLTHDTVIEGQILGPILWIGIFFLSGYYNQPFLKSRFEELKTTFNSVLIGSLFFFFAVILDDIPVVASHYFHLIAVLFINEFLFTYLFRYLITRRATRLIHGGKWGFNTLIIGTGKEAQHLISQINKSKQQFGYIIKGCIPSGSEIPVKQDIPVVGDMDNLTQIVARHQIERFIFAPDNRDRKEIFETIKQLFPFGLPIRMHADMQDIVLGKVKMHSLYETPMLDISRGKMSELQVNCKRTGDIITSCFALLLLSPLYLILAIFVKFDSKGPIFYYQERIGKFGRPFKIIKFRTMYVDAEKNGPALSAQHDPRITPLGYYMRKYRLDELPQFWNVLKGDMSLVGPRPERACYIEQISKQAPYYCLVHQIRPGITSWGMVKYGYATDVNQMIERLQYDLLYLENFSLVVDCKILIYTIRTVLTGRGI